MSEKSVAPFVAHRMKGNAARRVGGARESKPPQDRGDVEKGEPLAWICAFFKWRLLESPRIPGHWAPLGRAVAQEAGMVSSSPYQPGSPGYCRPALVDQVLWKQR